MENRITRHHKIPKSCGWNLERDNVVHWKTNFHRSFHHIFINDAPHEQIWTILDITGRAFQKRFRDDILAVIEWYDIEDIYKRKCFNMNKMIKHILKSKNG